MGNPILAHAVCLISRNALSTQRPLPSRPGAPDRSRTCDLWLRKPTLYPTELRAPAVHFTHRFRYSPFDRGVPVRCQYARAIMRASRYPLRDAKDFEMSDGQSTFIKTHQQLIVAVVLGFAIPIALIVSLSQLVTDMKPPGNAEAQSQLLSRIKPFGEVTMADASSPKGNLTGEQVFQSQCKTCHEPGIAGAPKVGDKAQWAVSIKKGYETLVQHAINGIQEAGKVMPPKGGNPDLTDVEVQRAVVYMANRSGANFKEPPAPTASVSRSTP